MKPGLEGRALIATLRGVKKRLNLIERELDLKKQEIKSGTQVARLNIKPGMVDALSSSTRRSMGRARAMRRQELREREHKSLAPYEAVENVIHNRLLLLDSAILEIEQQTAAQ